MLVLSDRVKQTTITSGSGLITLQGSFGGFQSFADAIGDGNVTYYTIENGSKFEVGIGTYNSNTLSRDLVLSSSNNGELIDLDGVSIVFCTYPADYSFFLNQQGYGTAQLPHYSGIQFPDGTRQITAAIQSFDGKENSLTYWSADSSLSHIDEITWDSSSSGLSLDGSLNIGNDVEISGSTLFYRDSAGCFFHAYVDNTYDNMVALYSNNSASPTWKLGIKPYSTDFSTPPTYGWVEGTNGRVSLNATSTTKVLLDYNNGFSITQQSSDLFISNNDDGTSVYNVNAATVPFKVIGAAAQSSNLQEWQDYSESAVASINPSGQISINSIKFPDETIQYTALKTEVIYKTITSSTSLDPLDDIIFVDCSSSSVDILLPTASGVGGKKIVIKRKAGGTHNLRILPSGSEELDSFNTFNMSYDNQSITVVSDNSNWFII